MEILARFANQNEKLPEEHYKKVESEMGSIFFPASGMILLETVTLGLKKILWMPRILVDGVRLN